MMNRFFGVRMPLRFPDEGVEYYKAEAQKAFQARDEAKAEIKRLRDEGLVLSAEDRKVFNELIASKKKIEEDKLAAAGEYDKLRKQLEDSHATALETERNTAATLRTRLHEQIIAAQFGGAADLFGGHAGARTIFDAPTAMKVLGEYVKVVDDPKAASGFRVEVAGPDGKAVTGSTFAEQLGKVIDALPNKDRILRGSGKAGSGSGGPGDGRSNSTDTRNLKAEDFSDPKVRAAVKDDLRDSGGIVHGRAFDLVDKLRSGAMKGKQ